MPEIIHSKRASARAVLPPDAPDTSSRTIGIVRAKVAVCDAYRAWLAEPQRPQRMVLCRALAALRRVELGGAS